MFPIRDNIPRRYPPYATRIIVGVNTLFFLYELGLDDRALHRLFYLLGFVPARYFHADWAQWVGLPEASVLPLFTHMFLHSGLLHFAANMWILWVFADNVEDVMGPVRFIGFYLLCGLAALAGHVLFNTNSTMPVVGASGAIAGVMGAYLLLYPRAQVLTLIPIFIFPFFVVLPALTFLGLWFLIQIFSGLFSMAGSQGGGVAWWAHAAGFVAGMIFVPFFKDDKRCSWCYMDSGRNSDTFRFH
ncbi:MAG: rhomboid family intramembrane serine protease [Desulfovermiculus sp.]|nr:rhomboid family intramembrane serine protease [Desulfovermiculus sp.]